MVGLRMIQEQQVKKETALAQEREAAWVKREDGLKAREQELQELRTKVEEFPTKLEQSIQKTREETTARVKREMQIRADLTAKEVADEKKVLEARIAYLEQTIEDQTKQLTSLKSRPDQSIAQVQSVAEKAIESQAGKQTLKAMSDIAMQQARSPRGEGE